MDGQNFNNGFDNNGFNNQNMDTASGNEPTPGTSSESVGETVNVNTGNDQGNTSSYGAYQYNASNTGSYSYQSSTTDNNNDITGGSYNYQDNTSQYYTETANTDNYNQQSASTPGLAIASLVLGIASILFCCCWGGGIVLAIPGIITGLSSNKKQKTGMGTAGLVCSIVGTVLNGFMLIYMVLVFAFGIASGM